MTCQNLILPKKQGSKFYRCNFSALRAALIVGQNPFRQRENLRNAGETHLVPTGEIDQKIDPSVTTSHLLLQDPPGETVALLPIWQPNSEFLKAKCSERAKGGGGVSQAKRPKVLDRNPHTEFYPYWFPCPFLLL